MKNKNKILIIVLFLALAMGNLFASGGDRTGTAGGVQLLIPVGARGIAMGSGNISNTYGIESLFWNPAGVAKLDHSVDLTFSHMNYIADIGVEYGAVATKIEGFGSLALSVKALSIGDIPITTTLNPDGTGAVFAPQMLTAGITYARQLTERISVGVTASYLTETLDKVSASGYAFNAGVSYMDLADINGLSFGLVLSNLGPQMTYSGSGLLVLSTVPNLNRPPTYTTLNAASFELPSSFQLGLGYKPQLDDINSLQIAGTFQNNNFSGDEYKIGAEYGYNNMFFARIGYQTSPKSQSDDYIYGFTAGVGINYDFEGIGLKVDYAYRAVKYLGDNHVFALSLGF
jgi:hypothetical protein